jgi:aminopeptidase N
LKEGLTRFRDQEFSSDMNSRVLNRIDDVTVMRGHQFGEDAGPNSHAIRPPSYREVSNFYTPTVYEKGAEVIRMVETLLGKPLFLKGIQKYFELYDGQAVTTEDFLHAMEVASGRDLTQFRESWYNQAGTPVLSVTSEYREDSQQYILRISQSLPRAQGTFRPFYLPFRMGLVGRGGSDLPLKLVGSTAESVTSIDLIISEPVHEFVFEGVSECPVPSLLRNFSAPVKVEYPYSLDELIVLSAFDSDPVNRFAASRLLARQMMDSYLGGASSFDPAGVKALGASISDRADPAYVAKAISLPSVQELGVGRTPVDYHALQQGRDSLRAAIANAYRTEWLPAFQYCSDRLAIPAVASSAEGAGLRALRLAGLGYLFEVDPVLAETLALGVLLGASTMTDEYGALLLLCRRSSHRNTALDLFLSRWSHKGDVMPSWFSAQVGTTRGDELEVLEALESHPAFDKQNPNLVRALYGGFLGNPTQFHRLDGSGYQLMADRIVAIDALNPQVAAGLAKGFLDIPRLTPDLKARAKAVLESLVSRQISSKVSEIITNTLAAIEAQ